MAPATASPALDVRTSKIAPKVFIIGMFDTEGAVWYGIPEFNLLGRNISMPGFSPLYPDAHCTLDGSVCQLVTGEGEINAAITLSALVASPTFDLSRTYFLIAGIGGINPKVATIGGVTFARYAVQVGLQFEFDAREIPSDWPTGYLPQGAESPDQYATRIYGTEVFELNDDLRQLAIRMAQTATLYDDADAQAYRALFASQYPAAGKPPSVVACDTATSDQFWSGGLLADAMENVTKLFTNGSATYCTTQQEDNATLEALTRGALLGLLDFSRIIVMRTGSNFDRPHAGQDPTDNLFRPTSGFVASILNVHLAGVQVVQGILKDWNSKFAAGIKPSHYVGDILGTLGGTPDFGPGSVFGGKKANSKRGPSNERRYPRWA
ncbi:purine nucleoside permease [Trametopsis cervina]|nr:purine nucleoside permease [Trametopsis cervina]